MTTATQKGCLRAFLALAAVALLHAAQAKGEGETKTDRSVRRSKEFTSGPYCGVYCLYAALRSLGVEARFTDLVDSKYIGSLDGSSLAELQRAAEDAGASARPMQGLTAASLRTAQHPILLHVRRPGKDMPYHHWVLFLGIEADQARILDPPGAPEPWPLADLLSLWDGVGLVVAKDAPDVGPMLVASWVQQGMVLAAVGGAVMIAYFLLRRIRRAHATVSRRGWLTSAGRTALGTLGLLALACVLAAGWHWISPEGFLRNRVAVALTVGRYFGADLPALSVTEVERVLDQDDVTIIDARLPYDYEAGHLKNAISLPITSGVSDRSRVLAQINPTNRVILYCQSDRCHWAEAIAADLVFRGYQRVELFPGGWNEWQQHERSKQSP